MIWLKIYASIAAFLILYSAILDAKSTKKPPRIVVGPTTKEVAVGETVSFYCSAMGSPQPSLYWTVNGKLVNHKTPDVAQKETVLKLKVTSKIVGGLYCCHANNGLHITDKLCAALHIKQAPTAKIVPALLIRNIGSNTSMQCLVSGRPPPSVNWYQNGILLQCSVKELCHTSASTSQQACICGKGVKVEGTTLMFSNLSVNHIGKYQCGVWNSFGQNISNTAFITVTHPFVPDMRHDEAENMTLPVDFSVPVDNQKLSSFFYPALSMIVIGLLCAVTCLVWHQHHNRCKRQRNVPSVNFDTSIKSNTDDCAMASMASSLEYPWKQLKFLHSVGKGNFGTVFKASASGLASLAGDQMVAVKTLHSLTQTNYKQMMNEANLLHSFSHPNIVQLLGVCFDNIATEASSTIELKPPFLLFEFIDGRDLHCLLRNLDLEKPLMMKTLERVHVNFAAFDVDDEKSLLFAQLSFCVDISCAMDYLSDHHYIHRDLAARNCLLSRDGVVKISDFGLSRRLNDVDYYRSSGEEALPVRWMAPECLLYGQYTVKSDVWSFAVTAWEIFTHGMQPYTGMSNEAVIKSIVQGSMLPKPSNAPTWVYNLMRLCWSEPTDRPPFNTIHSLFMNAMKNRGKLHFTDEKYDNL